MFRLEIVKPSGVSLQGDYDHVIVPGKDGDFGVSEGHTPLMATIRPGVLKLYNGPKSQPSLLAIHDGFAMIERKTVRIVCEHLETHDEIDLDRAQNAKQRAEKRLKERPEGTDFRRAEFALARALARLQASGH